MRKIKLLEEFISGIYTEEYQYKAFLPNPINEKWFWQDSEINILLEEANRKLGEINAFSILIPNIDLFIKMHITKDTVLNSCSSTSMQYGTCCSSMNTMARTIMTLSRSSWFWTIRNMNFSEYVCGELLISLAWQWAMALRSMSTPTGLKDVVVHTGLKKFLAIPVHGIGSHGNNGNSWACFRMLRRCGYAWLLRSHQVWASGCPWKWGPHRYSGHVPAPHGRPWRLWRGVQASRADVCWPSDLHRHLRPAECRQEQVDVSSWCSVDNSFGLWSRSKGRDT